NTGVGVGGYANDPIMRRALEIGDDLASGIHRQAIIEPESTGKKWVKSIPLNIHRSSRDFCSVWAFTHWVKMRNRVRARGYWSKPHFSLPYPWIWDRGCLEDLPG